MNSALSLAESPSQQDTFIQCGQGDHPTYPETQPSAPAAYVQGYLDIPQLQLLQQSYTKLERRVSTMQKDVKAMEKNIEAAIKNDKELRRYYRRNHWLSTIRRKLPKRFNKAKPLFTARMAPSTDGKPKKRPPSDQTTIPCTPGIHSGADEGTIDEEVSGNTGNGCSFSNP